MQASKYPLLQFRFSVSAGVFVAALHLLLFLYLIQLLHGTNFATRDSKTNSISHAIYPRLIPDFVRTMPIQSPSTNAPLRPLEKSPPAILRLNLDQKLAETIGKNEPIDEQSVPSRTNATEPSRAVELRPVETKVDSDEAVQVSKGAISGAAKRQEKNDRERKILGLAKDSDETVLAVQMGKSAKPDCLKPSNSDGTNNVSNLALAIGNIIQDKCNLR
jgi:hypothetical protein